MTHPLQVLLQGSNQPVNSLPPNSRYYPVATASLEKEDGTEVNYLKRRLIPPVDSFRTDQLYIVKQADRPDNLAAVFIGDPEQFWQLADGNNNIAPEALTAEPGSVLKITKRIQTPIY
ncbi:hypothetical protein A8C56_04790 [Niabella ginsenosidivorans]|uniref:LysM domain-containing protein n=1 Tax=Niabella ginsenosidivorans TaxID=1176587 RepID=A0A1A9HZY9_9BACT|nr:hypothetical protein [Niabella ginsenosidivorans]ANH80389.1 hypothetical protein A8C56_04790 [Niabella ginsenosidivorans]